MTDFMITNDFWLHCVEDTVIFERASKLDKITANLTSLRALKLCRCRVLSQLCICNCKQCALHKFDVIWFVIAQNPVLMAALQEDCLLSTSPSWTWGLLSLCIGSL